MSQIESMMSDMRLGSLKWMLLVLSGISEWIESTLWNLASNGRVIITGGMGQQCSAGSMDLPGLSY